MARRHALAGRRRQLASVCAALAAIAGLVLVVGAARAALLVPFVGMVWVVLRGPRWEARLFGARPTPPAPVRPEVWARPVPPLDGTGRAEAHRAYARALHAVTGAYLAECEREVGR